MWSIHAVAGRPDPACRRFVQALAALKRLVNGYTNSVSPAKLINRMDDDDQSVDMDKLVFSDPILSVSVSSSATRTTRSD